MAGDVRVIGGIKTRYFTYGASLPQGAPATTISTISVPGNNASNPNGMQMDNQSATLQVICPLAAATVIFEGTNEDASSQNVPVTGLPQNNNWCPVTGTAASSTVTLAAGGTGCIIISNTPWRWIRARVTSASQPLQCLMSN